jgi:acetylornithine deacetylase/succinyl-diaminopimelate desuccinylase-like protein
MPSPHRSHLERPTTGRAALALTLVVAAWLGGCGPSSGAASQTVPPAVVPSFDGTKALASITAQCDLGPRTPGSDAHSACLQWIQDQLGPLTSRVFVQTFDATTTFGGPYHFANVLAWVGPATGAPMLLAAHWDSRPAADEDPDPANHTKPVPGANDGASGVAVLLEIARLAHGTPLPAPVILAFLDAEDSGKGSSAEPYMGFCLGAQHLAANWPAGWTKPTRGILFDLVGGDGKPDPRIPNPPVPGHVLVQFGLETNSLDANASLVNTVWSQAETLGHKTFVRTPSGEVTDDHVPFIKAGIAMIDIIDVFPPVWHTIDDTPAHCSADTLRQVGDTVVHVLYGSG